MKQLVILILIGILLMTVAGCAAVDALRAATEPTKEPETLSFAFPWDGSGVYKRLSAKFSTEQADITIQTMEGGSIPVYLEALEEAFKAGENIPDLLLLHDAWIPYFAEKGYIQPMDGFLEESLSKELYMSEELRIRRQLYGLPLSIDTPILYYRSDLVEAPPSTYGELVEMGKRVLRQGLVPSVLIYPGSTPENTAYFAASFLMGFDAWPSLGQARVRIPEAKVLEALSVYSGLVKEGILSETSLRLTPEGCRQMFEQGQALFMWNWSYAFRLMTQEDAPLYGKVGAAPMPTVSGEGGPGVVTGWVLAASNTPDRLAERSKFIRFITSKEAQFIMALNRGLLPARSDLYETALDWHRQRPMPPGLKEILDNGRPMGTGPDFDVQIKLFHQVFTQGLGQARDAVSMLDALSLGLTRETMSGEDGATEEPQESPEPDIVPEGDS